MNKLNSLTGNRWSARFSADIPETSSKDASLIAQDVVNYCSGKPSDRIERALATRQKATGEDRQKALLYIYGNRACYRMRNFQGEEFLFTCSGESSKELKTHKLIGNQIVEKVI